MTPTRSRSRRPSERGAVVIWLALFMFLFLGFMALGIDAAKLTTTKTQLQNAADAAALAAASAVDPATGKITPTLAVSRAQETGSLNGAFIGDTRPVFVDPADVVLLSGNRVRVTTRRTGATSVVAQMAQVIGLSRFDMSATAVAKADTARGVQCVLPIGVNMPPGDSFVPGCGNLYSLKNGPGGGVRGNYGYLAMPDCPDTPCHQPPQNPHQLECLIANGYCCGLETGQSVNTAPGNKSPAAAGIDDRFSADTDKRESICYAAYHGNGQRVVTVPLVTPFPSGSSGSVTVTGFASFFLQSKPNKSDGMIKAEFVYISTAGRGGGAPSSGAVSYVVRLSR